MINTAAQARIFLLFQYVQQLIVAELFSGFPRGFYGVFGYIPGSARLESARDSPLRTIIPDHSVGHVPFFCNFGNRYEFHNKTSPFRYFNYIPLSEIYQ